MGRMKQILNRAWFEQRIIARIAVVIEDTFRNERKVYFFAVLWRQISSINWHNIHRNLQMADMNFLMPMENGRQASLSELFANKTEPVMIIIIATM